METNHLAKIEGASLSKFAAKNSSKFLTQRFVNEFEKDEFEVRESFQRDRDRIVHSRAFRRLMHKTQVFNANMGDHYRNRLTHTMEVNQIARSIGKYLGLNDELIEAIALGHDLGHTPFGHIGERTLHLIISGKLGLDEAGVNSENHGGFKHNFQGLQIIDNLEKRSDEYRGMNLTLAVREGILKHTSMKIKIPYREEQSKTKKTFEQDIKYSSLDLENINIDLPSFTLEGQVVAIADEIAQCTHDLEDGLRAKIISLDNIKDNELIQKIWDDKKLDIKNLKETVDIRNTLIKYMVGYLIEDVCKTSSTLLSKIPTNEIPQYSKNIDVYKKNYISFSEEEDNIKKMHKDLTELITRFVISSQLVTQSDAKAEYIIKKLFKAYYVHPQQLPDQILIRYFKNAGRGEELNRLIIDELTYQLQSDGDFIRAICDHIASMTDQYAAREYKKLYEPDYV